MANNHNQRSYIFFGDSLINRTSIVTADPCYDLPDVGTTVEVLAHKTGGFYGLLQTLLQLTYPENRIHFQNFARGGASSFQLQSQLDGCIDSQTIEQQPQENAALICIGTNDASHDIFGLGKAVTLEQFKYNYGASIKKAVHHFGTVHCILPPEVQVLEQKETINQRIRDFNETIIDIASTFENVQVIDLFSHFEQTDQAFANTHSTLSLRISDGVHLSELGNQLAANIIWDALLEDYTL